MRSLFVLLCMVFTLSLSAQSKAFRSDSHIVGEVYQVDAERIVFIFEDTVNILTKVGDVWVDKNGVYEKFITKNVQGTEIVVSLHGKNRTYFFTIKN